LESLLDTARDPQERDGIYEKLRLRQEETKRELERLSRNLRLHWGGSTVLKPTLTPEHKTKRFEQLVEVQNKLRSAWDVWLADSRRLDQTRRKALATGTAAADLMQLRLDLLVAQLAHKEAHILALESKYEWYQNNEMRGRVAQELFDGRNTARLLKEQIRDARRRVESRD
jgi:hypothetical protein